MSRKPVFGVGGPLTDSQFNLIKMTKHQAQQYANKQARKVIKSGLSTFAVGFVVDCGKYFRISVGVSKPRSAA